MEISARILLVDDHAPWRQQVHSILRVQPQLCIVAEVADGLNAVQKAQELQPDLILLDIGLPNLNGFEAAKRIHRVAPKSRILFLSQNSDKDIVQATLSNGARGYVLKTDALSELLPAVRTVLDGEEFVSSGIKGDDVGQLEIPMTPSPA